MDITRHSQSITHPTDSGDCMWLHFNRRPYQVDQQIQPDGVVSPEREDLYRRGQYRPDRIYIVWAESLVRVSRAAWNDADRWCYQVEPEGQLERDPDLTHRNVFDSWMCPTVRVIQILREPSSLD
jgi:hypothetical protein